MFYLLTQKSVIDFAQKDKIEFSNFINIITMIDNYYDLID